MVTATEKRLVNIQELAEAIGVSDRTLHEHYKNRNMPHVRIGRSVRFDVEKCVQHFEQQTVADGAE